MYPIAKLFLEVYMSKLKDRKLKKLKRQQL